MSESDPQRKSRGMYCPALLYQPAKVVTRLGFPLRGSSDSLCGKFDSHRRLGWLVRLR
jgi:hypothetical protein